MRPASASSIAGNRSVVIRAFTTYPNAPVAKQVRTKSGSEWTVRKIIFEVQPDSFNWLAASMPLRTGIEISVTITSGFRLMAA